MVDSMGYTISQRRVLCSVAPCPTQVDSSCKLSPVRHSSPEEHDHVSVRRQGQPLTASFKGTVNLGCFAGHATNLATCDPALFDGIVEVAPGVLRPTGGTVCVDLVEPGCQPVTALTAHKIVEREIFTNLEPHVVITIYSPDPDLTGLAGSKCQLSKAGHYTF